MAEFCLRTRVVGYSNYPTDCYADRLSGRGPITDPPVGRRGRRQALAVAGLQSLRMQRNGIGQRQRQRLGQLPRPRRLARHRPFGPPPVGSG